MYLRVLGVFVVQSRTLIIVDAPLGYFLVKK
jgi:hypothetical protein